MSYGYDTKLYFFILYLFHVIYHIILYETNSGKLILDIVFKEIIGEDTLFTGFISALKSFGADILKNQPKNINMIRFDNLIIKIFTITELNIDIVILFDPEPEHYKIVNEILPKIKTIIFEYETLFTEWNGMNLSEFQILAEPILNLIRNSIFAEAIVGAL